MVRKICNGIIAVIFILIGTGLLMLLIPVMLGNRLYSVQSGSMEPNFAVGSIIVVEPVVAQQLNVGDVIVFQTDRIDLPITHRVVEIDAANRQLITKGDNNQNIDAFPVLFENVTGRVLYGLPYMGYIVTGLRTPAGFLAALWLALGILLLVLVPYIVYARRKPKQAGKVQHKKHDVWQVEKPEKWVYSAKTSNLMK